jgi:hypothetical protein
MDHNLNRLSGNVEIWNLEENTRRMDALRPRPRGDAELARCSKIRAQKDEKGLWADCQEHHCRHPRVLTKNADVCDVQLKLRERPLSTKPDQPKNKVPLTEVMTALP